MGLMFGCGCAVVKEQSNQAKVKAKSAAKRKGKGKVVEPFAVSVVNTFTVRVNNGVVRAHVSKMDLDSVFKNGNRIAIAIQKEMEKILEIFFNNAYTLDDESVRKPVKRAETTKEKAEAEKKMLQEWREYVDSKCVTRLGMASQFQAIATHIKDALLFIQGIAAA